MLPNHSSLKVAENFRLLEGLYPGRIDLGIGRAPGGDRLTASLLNPSNGFDPKDYVRQINELRHWLRDDATPGTVHEKVKAIPVIKTEPELWILTSSGESAYIAAHFSTALSFAHFINPSGGPEAIAAYHENFKPTLQMPVPKTSVGIFVFCSDDPKTAERVQAVMDFRLLSIERGRTDESPSWESVKDNVYTPEEKARIRYNRQRMIVGTPEVAEQKLTEIAKAYQTDEIVISTFADRMEDRLHSYELLARRMAIDQTPVSVN